MTDMDARAPGSYLKLRHAYDIIAVDVFIIVLICVFDEFEPYTCLSLKSVLNIAELSVLLLPVVAESSQPAPI